MQKRKKKTEVEKVRLKKNNKCVWVTVRMWVCVWVQPGHQECQMKQWLESCRGIRCEAAEHKEKSITTEETSWTKVSCKQSRSKRRHSGSKSFVQTKLNENHLYMWFLSTFGGRKWKSDAPNNPQLPHSVVRTVCCGDYSVLQEKTISHSGCPKNDEKTSRSRIIVSSTQKTQSKSVL